jgi:Fe-S-cluster containining protein
MSTIREGLLAICDDLEADIARAAPVCELSGRCCRFKEYGHTLFLSRPEAEWLLEQGLPENATIDEAGCPFQIGGLCTARERRPLGCRVYYCDPRYAGVGEELSERYLRRLKQLHDETGTPWEYRPLHVFLNESVPPHEAGPQAPSHDPPSH